MQYDVPQKRFSSVRRGSPHRASGWTDGDDGSLMGSWVAAGSHVPPVPPSVSRDAAELDLQRRSGSGSPYQTWGGRSPVAQSLSVRRENGVGFVTQRQQDRLDRKEQTQDWVGYNAQYSSPSRSKTQRCRSCGAGRDVPHGPRKPDSKQHNALRRELVSDWVDAGGDVPRGARRLYIPHTPWPDGSGGGIVEVPIPKRKLLHPDTHEMVLWPDWRDTHVTEGPPPPEMWREHAMLLREQGNAAGSR